jgi:hypothetical protein
LLHQQRDDNDEDDDVDDGDDDYDDDVDDGDDDYDDDDDNDDDDDHSDSKSPSIVTNLPQRHHSTCKIKSIIQHFPPSTAAVLPELLAAQLAGPDDL